MKTVIIDNYDSFTYNLFQIIAWLLGGESNVTVVRNNINLGQLEKLNPARLIISPGPGKPPDDTGVCGDAISHFAGKIPILGVCLGHQTIGYVFGGTIVPAKTVMHGKASPLHIIGGSLFDQNDVINVGRYHSLAIDQDTLPKCLKITAETDDHEIMAVEHRLLPNVIGVQFHPESLLTAGGHDVYSGPGSKMLSTFLSL